MPAHRTPIDRDEFQTVVTHLENHNRYHSPSALWRAVAASVWASGLKKRLSPRSFAERAKELEILYETRLHRLRFKPVISRKTKQVDYLYRIMFSEKGTQRILTRDLRDRRRIKTVEDVERIEGLIGGKLLSWDRMWDV